MTRAHHEPGYELIEPPGGRPIKAWTRGVPVEEEARAQLARMAQLPFIYKWLAVMPDVHLGKGATVGSVIPTTGAIIPAAVGVDLGCGMIAARTTLTASDLPDDLKSIRLAIEHAVPHGRTAGGRAGRDRGAWGTPPERVQASWSRLAARHRRIVDKHPEI